MNWFLHVNCAIYEFLNAFKFSVLTLERVMTLRRVMTSTAGTHTEENDDEHCGNSHWGEWWRALRELTLGRVMTSIAGTHWGEWWRALQALTLGRVMMSTAGTHTGESDDEHCRHSHWGEWWWALQELTLGRVMTITAGTHTGESDDDHCSARHRSLQCEYWYKENRM